ncbi:hypothetical protein BDQ17DRAFT_1334297 [Cyathus striatus]|nr:hypothetical protein BDQ17DRAFT_1334297 [Cyathus striatus]
MNSMESRTTTLNYVKVFELRPSALWRAAYIWLNFLALGSREVFTLPPHSSRTLGGLRGIHGLSGQTPRIFRIVHEFRVDSSWTHFSFQFKYTWSPPGLQLESIG